MLNKFIINQQFLFLIKFIDTSILVHCMSSKDIDAWFFLCMPSVRLFNSSYNSWAVFTPRLNQMRTWRSSLYSPILISSVKSIYFQSFVQPRWDFSIPIVVAYGCGLNTSDATLFLTLHLCTVPVAFSNWSARYEEVIAVQTRNNTLFNIESIYNFYLTNPRYQHSNYSTSFIWIIMLSGQILTDTCNKHYCNKI